MNERLSPLERHWVPSSPGRRSGSTPMQTAQLLALACLLQRRRIVRKMLPTTAPWIHTSAFPLPL